MYAARTVRRGALTPPRARGRYAPRMNLLWAIVVVLVLLWLLGLVLRAFGGLIHLLIIAALVIVIYRLLTGRRVF